MDDGDDPDTFDWTQPSRVEAAQPVDDAVAQLRENLARIRHGLAAECQDTANLGHAIASQAEQDGDLDTARQVGDQAARVQALGQHLDGRA